MGTKAKHKGLVLALLNQTLLTSKLADVPVSESLTRYANCPAFHALREMKKLPRIGLQKKHGAHPACRDGGAFEKTPASLLARGFAKKAAPFAQRIHLVIFLLPHLTCACPLALRPSGQPSVALPGARLC